MIYHIQHILSTVRWALNLIQLMSLQEEGTRHRVKAHMKTGRDLRGTVTAKVLEPTETGRGRKALPWRPQGECDPDDTLILDF